MLPDLQSCVLCEDVRCEFNGMQTLVAHTVYRPRSDNRGPQVFQLHPNGWRFGPLLIGERLLRRFKVGKFSRRNAWSCSLVRNQFLHA